MNSEISQFEVNLNDFTEVEAQLDKLESSLNNLKPEVEYFYVFALNTEQTQKEFDVSLQKYNRLIIQFMNILFSQVVMSLNNRNVSIIKT